MSLKMYQFDISTLQKLEENLQAGQMETTKQFLDKISKQKIKRNQVAKVASLARRVGFHRLAIKLLAPIVCPKKPTSQVATDDEKIEYAVNLIRISLVNEAFIILSAIDEKKKPDVLLFKSFCYFVSWDYDKAIPLLKQYIKFESVSDYQKLVAQTNMAAGYISEVDFFNAEKILKNILTSADHVKNKLLIGYTHQLYAEYYINLDDSKKAQAHISVAHDFLRKTHFRYELYNLQWSAIIKMMSLNTLVEGQNLLNAVRAEAIQKKVWEVLRDCNLYEALLTQNSELLIQLYFGTPHEKYRQRIIKLNNKKINIPEYYTWLPMGKPSNENHLLDVIKGEDKFSVARLKLGGLTHKLLQILVSDFYRPFKLQTLFSLLFSEENYNITTSLHKVQDLIGRLREWFIKNSIPLDVVSTKREEFHLKFLKPYAIRLKIYNGLLSTLDYFLESLQKKFPDESFTVKDVMLVSGYSRAQAKQLISEALVSKRLVVFGVGRSTRYNLNNSLQHY